LFSVTTAAATNEKETSITECWQSIIVVVDERGIHKSSEHVVDAVTPELIAADL